MVKLWFNRGPMMVNNDQRIMVDNGQMMVDNEGLYPTIVGHIMFNDD